MDRVQSRLKFHIFVEKKKKIIFRSNFFHNRLQSVFTAKVVSSVVTKITLFNYSIEKKKEKKFRRFSFLFKSFKCKTISKIISTLCDPNCGHFNPHVGRSVVGCSTPRACSIRNSIRVVKCQTSDFFRFTIVRRPVSEVSLESEIRRSSLKKLFIQRCNFQNLLHMNAIR